MTFSIYKNMHFYKGGALVMKNVCFPLKSDLIENKVA